MLQSLHVKYRSPAQSSRYFGHIACMLGTQALLHVETFDT